MTPADALAYIIHRLRAGVDATDGRVSDEVAEDLEELREDLTSTARTALESAGLSINFYADGSPVEPVVFREPGHTHTLIRRPGEPMTLPHLGGEQ